MAFIVILIIGTLLYIFRQQWFAHLSVALLIFGFYIFLWLTMLSPERETYPIYAFYYLNILTIPIITAYYLCVMFFARKYGFKKIFRVNFIGLILVLINLTCFILSMTI